MESDYGTLYTRSSEELQREMEAIGERRLVAKGTVLYEEGFPCPMVPLILSGSVRVFKMGESGREITLYRVEPGQICILSSTCAMATQEAKLPAVAVAEADVEMIAVPVHLFRKMLHSHPEVQGTLNQMLTERLAEMMMVVDEVAFGRLDIRLGEHLLRAASDAPDNMVIITHQELAMELGSAREVISRVLKDYERRGFLHLGRGKIELLDQPGLRSLIEARAA